METKEHTPNEAPLVGGGVLSVRTTYSVTNGFGRLEGFDDEGTQWPIDFCDEDDIPAQGRMLAEINRRVNAHDELLAALTSLCDLLEADEIQNHGGAITYPGIERARQAIKLATPQRASGEGA